MSCSLPESPSWEGFERSGSWELLPGVSESTSHGICVLRGRPRPGFSTCLPGSAGSSQMPPSRGPATRASLVRASASLNPSCPPHSSHFPPRGGGPGVYGADLARLFNGRESRGRASVEG